MELGVDGCRAGWIAVFRNGLALDYRICPDVAQLAAGFSDARLILIDVPIGLPWAACSARPCDVLARRWLSPYGRAASVFSPPGRHAAHAGSYREACVRNQTELGRQLSIQSWNICNRIAEVDLFLRAPLRPAGLLREAHPEICLAALNGGRAMDAPKKHAAGAAQRLAVLSRFEPGAGALVERVMAGQRRSVVQRDDVIDALACLVTATRGGLHSLQGDPACDALGLPMEMVYAPA